jgi:hypothetical protein
MTPWLIGELTPYPNGLSREQLEAGSGAGPADAWVTDLSREWRTTFFLGGCCNLAGVAAFLALASDRVQPWARAPANQHGSSSSGGGGTRSADVD